MRQNKNVATLDISTKVQIWAAMMARSLKSCLMFSIEFRLQSAHPASQPPDDLEIVRLKRPEVRGQTVLPRPSGVTRTKGEPRA